MGYLKFTELRYLVLDEADRMLDMGFYDDLMKIIQALPQKRQNLFFSATMPPQMRKLAHSILVDPVEVNIAISRPPEQIVQGAFLVYDQQKQPLVQHILKERKADSILIFCSSKQSVKQLAALLSKNRFSCRAIHSDLEQNEREQTLLDFRNKKFSILIATDVISRGIDIDHIDLVINYDVPHDGEDYVHRIGRTARASSKGTAYTLITQKEQRKFAKIEKLLGTTIEKLPVPQELGPAPEPSLASPHSKKKQKKRFKR
jgi:superfamily II DNA/RNA helicase